jgi:hypothetical protein
MSNQTAETQKDLDHILKEMDRIAANLARATAEFWETEKRLAIQTHKDLAQIQLTW